MQELWVDERYAPVSIANWKLVPHVAQVLLARRVTQPLSFGNGRLAVVIPYRDRRAHLQYLLPLLTAKLDEDGIEHRIFVVEQEPGALFNRGRLLNIGMRMAADWSDYYCLHDVDAIPLTANYQCPSQPLRLVTRVLHGTREHLRSGHYFSGAVSIRREQALAVNGFANEYWGWGKEDDDFFFRLLLGGFLCFLDQRGTFRDLPNPAHQCIRNQPDQSAQVRRNRDRRSRLLRGLIDPADDGFSTLQFSVTERVRHARHEHLRVRW